MKKVLFLTTAMIATGSMAAADVRISGYGRFGLDYNEANKLPAYTGALTAQTGTGVITGTPTGGTVRSETSITSRLRLQFDYSAETDGGITFGGRNRFQIESRDNAPGGPQGINGARFFVSYSGFTVAAGNILGAIDAMRGLALETRTAGAGIDGMGFNSYVSNMGNNFFDYTTYSSAGAGANGVEAIYNGQNFGAHLSYAKVDDTFTGSFNNTAAIPRTTTKGETNAGISIYGTFSNWTLALGYNDEKNGTTNSAGVNNDNDLLVLSVAADLGFGAVRLAYGEMKNLTTITSAALTAQETAHANGLAFVPTAASTVTNKARKVGLYGSFDVGASTSLVAFITNERNKGAATDGTGGGLHVSHDLGGGASIEAAVTRTSLKQTQFQAGVYFSF